MLSQDVDVVVVNYNAGALLTRCIQSVLSEGVAHAIVSDNNSTDKSLTILVEKIKDPRLLVVRNETNLGFAAGCNAGLEHAESSDVLFLNPDGELETGALKRLRQALHSAGEIGMVGGLLLNPDGTEQRGGRRYFPTPASAFAFLFRVPFLQRIVPGMRPFNLSGDTLPAEPTEVEAISGACMLVRRQVIAELGNWDEGYFLHGEDLDLCKRFAQAGWKTLFVPDAKVRHVKGASTGTTHLAVEWHKHRGMMRFYRKFYARDYPLPFFWLVSLGVWIHFAMIIYRVVVIRAFPPRNT